MVGTEEIDYAIVGGGISGVYCAYRLKQNYPEKKIVVFEYTDRIGGRLFTVWGLGGADTKAELGGMRYNPATHPHFTHLVQELGLTPEDFLMGPPADPTGQNNVGYFRGKHLTIGDLPNPEKSPFNVSLLEENKNPDDLQGQVSKTYFPNFANYKDQDWFSAQILGKPLYEWGFWNLLYRVLSQEAYLYEKYACGYDTNVANGNSVLLLPTGGDYSPTNHYKTVSEGMDTVPKTLAKKFEELSKRNSIRTNQCLVSIEKLGGGKEPRYVLKFFKTKTQGKVTTVDSSNESKIIAKKVILALPRAPLQKIRFKEWDDDVWYKENLKSVLIQNAMKIYLAYDFPWWKSLGLTAGRSITDLPLRQIYYFIPKGDICDNTVPKKPALLMASYNDIETVPFWKGLESGDKGRPLGPANCSAPASMVEEAHRQVVELHGQKELSTPIEGAYMDWGDTPCGAAWHSWKAGYRQDKIWKKIIHPVSSENVYICGEAFSEWNQGWSEGALETAVELLKEHFGISPSKEHQKAIDAAHPDPQKRITHRLMRWIGNTK